jgi:hypothetical protein
LSNMLNEYLKKITEIYIFLSNYLNYIS